MPRKKTIPVAMTIAGSDPGGGAGLQADLKTFAALGVYGFSALTMVIAQNSARVARTIAVEAEMLIAQIVTLIEEHAPDSLKIGALGNAANVVAVADIIRTAHLPAPVIDPVLVSSSGARLLDLAGEAALIKALLPLARIVTPNLPEAALLCGFPIDSPAVIREAARAIRGLGAQAVVIKGGHPLSGGEGGRSGRSIDLFFDGHSFLELSAARLPGDGAHGTGCAFSSAIAAHLARGASLEDAVRGAKRFVTRALRKRFVLGNGRPLLDHFASRRG